MTLVILNIETFKPLSLSYQNGPIIYANRFAGSISRYDPREPLPAEFQEDAFHVSHEYRGPEVNLALQANSYLPHLAPLTSTRQAHPTPHPPSLHPKLPTFTVQEPHLGRNVLPPISISIEASVIQDTVSVTATQLFWNDSDSVIKEAAYTFPLSSGCTVTDFTCRIGHNKILRGDIKAKEDAREAFQQHINNHATGAALLEQHTEEIFTTSLGNLPAKTKIRVTITYITLLKHHFADSKETTTLTIPTCIASRYGDKPQDYNDAAPTSVPEGLTLQIEVIEADKITLITSPTHKIAVQNQLGTRNATSFADLAGQDTGSSVETALVKLESGSTFLDRDFVLDIVTSRPNDDTEAPHAWIERHPTLPNQQALMLTVPSGFTTRTSDPSDKTEILLLADLSGSMVDKISSLKAAMQFFLKGIPQGRKFNIWCFGSNYKSWQFSSVEYCETSYHSAASWVEANFEANMGGTELLPAVKAIVTARDKRLPTDIIILTDGETWRLDETLEYIRKQRDLTEGRVRFFALGIGKAVSHALVEGIAKAGGGYAEVVREASEGGWEDRVVSMAEAALMTDHLGPMHLEVTITGSGGSSRVSSIHNAEQSPADISTISPFNRNRIYFLFDSFKPSESITNITLTASSDRGTKSLGIPVTVLEKTNTTIHRLAARSMLDDLERGQSHIHLGPSRPYPGSLDERNRVRKEAERIACKWSLVSKWTSFFLKEEPYHADPGDTWCAEDVVEVTDEPGDNLLESRGPVAHVAMIEDMNVPTGVASDSVLIGQLVQTSETRNRLPGLAAFQQQHTMVRGVATPPRLALGGNRPSRSDYDDSVSHFYPPRDEFDSPFYTKTVDHTMTYHPSPATHHSRLSSSDSGASLPSFELQGQAPEEALHHSLGLKRQISAKRPIIVRPLGPSGQRPSRKPLGSSEQHPSKKLKSAISQDQTGSTDDKGKSIPPGEVVSLDDLIIHESFCARGPVWDDLDHGPTEDSSTLVFTSNQYASGYLPTTTGSASHREEGSSNWPQWTGEAFSTIATREHEEEITPGYSVDPPEPNLYSAHSYSPAVVTEPEAVLINKSSDGQGKQQDFCFLGQARNEITSTDHNEKDKPWTENRIIPELLRFQSSKGYFSRGYSLEKDQTDPIPSTTNYSEEDEDSKHLTLLCDFLGKEITGRLRILRDKDSKDHLFGEASLRERNLFTVAVCVLLERDFASKRSLWILMRRKAEGYLRECLSDVDKAFEEVRIALDGVKIEGYKPLTEPQLETFAVAEENDAQVSGSKSGDSAVKGIAKPKARVRIWSLIDVVTGETQGNSGGVEQV
ncbi:von Willebrand factor type A domain-containing protein [Apiosordaria backusii]|uniref:von Willebrand factor type A domain-containing protein n=1 Tax=Apiosordaria backusii TaxID=314023 RepID=A0AA40EGP1_9PEZI|nr:von Willebrand factor type A domain-containing protein [Apiosordaria backusii]